MPVCPTSIGPAAMAANTPQSLGPNPVSGAPRNAATTPRATAATAYTADA